MLKQCQSEDPAAATPASAAEGPPEPVAKAEEAPEPALKVEEAPESVSAEPTAGPSAKKQPEVYPDLPTATPCSTSCTQYQPYKSVILEALSATGLRSIRYAKEIPLVKYVHVGA